MRNPQNGHVNNPVKLSKKLKKKFSRVGEREEKKKIIYIKLSQEKKKLIKRKKGRRSRRR